MRVVTDADFGAVVLDGEAAAVLVGRSEERRVGKEC